MSPVLVGMGRGVQGGDVRFCSWTKRKKKKWKNLLLRARESKRARAPESRTKASQPCVSHDCANCSNCTHYARIHTDTYRDLDTYHSSSLRVSLEDETLGQNWVPFRAKFMFAIIRLFMIKHHLVTCFVTLLYIIVPYFFQTVSLVLI